ncbi:arginase family protein [Bacillus sp. SCS-151]|uniref:arginase family protein n=1 Tax=Nanhaiella sioensis TaxID=3115293 RepID=UPI00397DEF40
MKNKEKYIIRQYQSKILFTDRNVKTFWESEYEIPTIHPDEQSHLFSPSECSYFSYPHSHNGNIHLFGFPYNKGTQIKDSNVKKFPSSLRLSSTRIPIYMDKEGSTTSGIFDYLAEDYLMKYCLLVDHGDIKIDNSASLNDLIGITSKILNPIIGSLKTKFGVIGGDHFITYILIKSILDKLNKKIVIFQFDAHHDCGANILKTDKEPHHANFVRFLLDEEKVAGIIQIGVRGLRSLGQKIEHPKLYQIPANMMNFNLVRKALNVIYKNNETEDLYGYISFDVDVIDPSDFPLVDFPKTGGPKLEDIIQFIHFINEEFNEIIGFDIVEGLSEGRSDQYDPVLQVLVHILNNLTNPNRK